MLSYVSPIVGVPICIILVGLGIYLMIRAYSKKPPQDIPVTQNKEHGNRLSTIVFEILDELTSQAEVMEKAITIRKLDDTELLSISNLYRQYGNDVISKYKFCVALIMRMDELQLGIAERFDSNDWRASIKKLDRIKIHLGNSTINELIEEYVLFIKGRIYDNSFQRYSGWATHLSNEVRNKFLNQIQVKLTRELKKYGDSHIDGVTEETTATHPIISVEAIVYYDCAKLEITNNGFEADFAATARVVEGIVKPELYTMCWGPNPVTPRHINKGETATILVAQKAKESAKTDWVEKAVIRNGIELFKLENGHQGSFGASTFEHVQKRQLDEMYPTMKDTYTLKDDCVIEVTITASPTLIEPFEKRRYRVKIDDARGHQLIFEPVDS